MNYEILNSIESLSSSLESYINNLDNIWQGDAADNVESLYSNTLKPQIKEVKQQIINYKSALKFAEKAQEYKAKINSINNELSNLESTSDEYKSLVFERKLANKDYDMCFGSVKILGQRILGQQE